MLAGEFSQGGRGAGLPERGPGGGVDQQVFAEHLGKLLSGVGLTVDQLARRLDLAPAMLHRYFTGAALPLPEFLLAFHAVVEAAAGAPLTAEVRGSTISYYRTALGPGRAEWQSVLDLVEECERFDAMLSREYAEQARLRAAGGGQPMAERELWRAQQRIPVLEAERRRRLAELVRAEWELPPHAGRLSDTDLPEAEFRRWRMAVQAAAERVPQPWWPQPAQAVPARPDAGGLRPERPQLPGPSSGRRSRIAIAVLSLLLVVAVTVAVTVVLLRDESATADGPAPDRTQLVTVTASPLASASPVGSVGPSASADSSGPPSAAASGPAVSGAGSSVYRAASPEQPITMPVPEAPWETVAELDSAPPVVRPYFCCPPGAELGYDGAHLTVPSFAGINAGVVPKDGPQPTTAEACATVATTNPFSGRLSAQRLSESRGLCLITSDRNVAYLAYVGAAIGAGGRYDLKFRLTLWERN